MNATDTLGRINPLDKIATDAIEYQPTPQEIRWGMIEHRARTLVSAIRKNGHEGMSEEAIDALGELRHAIESIEEPK